MKSGSTATDPFGPLAEVWSRRKWLALAILGLTASTGVTVALGLPNLYRSTATVIVEQGRSELAASADLESRLQLIGQEIFSRSRLEGLIRRFNLYPTLQPRASMEGVVDQMRRDIRTESKVQPQANGLGATIAFAISYRGPDPQVVANVANALASFYLEEDVKIRERQTSGTVQVLKAQLDDVKRDLQEQERALAAFQEEHTGELPQQAEANIANLGRLDTQLRTTSDERIRAIDRRNELQKEVAEAEGAGPSTGAIPAPVVGRLAKKKEELADLSRRYSDRYPDVIRLKEEVAALEREAASTEADRPDVGGAAASRAARLRTTLDEVEAEISTFKAEEAQLRAQIGEYLRRLENTPRRQRASQEVARDYQTTRDLYDSLRKRYEQAQLEEGGDGRPLSQFRILDPAIVPANPVAPNRLVLLFVALVSSLVAAAAAVALAEKLDTTMHTADEVRSFTRVPVLASVPRIDTAGDVRSRRRRFWLRAASVLLATGLVVHAVHDVARKSDGLVSTLARGRS